MASPGAWLTLAALVFAAVTTGAAAANRSSDSGFTSRDRSASHVASGSNVESAGDGVSPESVDGRTVINGLDGVILPTPTDNDLVPMLAAAPVAPKTLAEPVYPQNQLAPSAVSSISNIALPKSKDTSSLPDASSLPLAPSFTPIPSAQSPSSATPSDFLSPVSSAARSSSFSSSSASLIGPADLPKPLVLPTVPAAEAADLAIFSPAEPVSSTFFNKNTTAKISVTPASTPPVPFTSFVAPAAGGKDEKRAIEYYTNAENRHPVVVLQKCCRKGEELNEALHCIKRKDFNATDKEQPWVFPNDTDVFRWLPKEFTERHVQVHLNKLKSPRRLALVLTGSEDTDNYNLLKDGNLTVNIREGFELELMWSDYCIDAINGQNPVFVSWNCGSTRHCFNKCCPQNQLLILQNGAYECVKPPSKEPPTPIFFEHYLSVNYLIHDRTYTRCVNGTFQLLRRDDFYPEEIIDFISATESKPLLVKEFSESDVCGDWVLNEDGIEEGVVGYCARKLSTWRLMWVTSQALCIPAAFFLMLSLLAVAIMPELRATTHGRALTCHAASLFLFNGLHVIVRYFSRHPKFWQYFEFNFPSCRYKAYFAHFALHAANFWLNVVSINIALGFRRVQRAPGAKRNELKTFLIYSVYAWGCPIILTILTIVCWEREIAREPGVTKLAFLETRTCFFDYAESTENKFSNSTLYLYYLPTSLLLLSNLGLFAYTMYKICRLRRDTAIVRRPEEGREPPTHDSAWLYVRLLVSTGIVEAAIEIATWSASTETIPDRRDDTLEMLKNTITPYEVLLNTVDVVRAIFIFWATCCAPRILKRVKARISKTMSSGRRIWQLRGGPRAEDTELGPVTTSSGRTGEDVIVYPARADEEKEVPK